MEYNRNYLFLSVKILITLAVLLDLTGAKFTIGKKIAHLIPDKSDGKLMRNELKIFFTNINLRRVPLAQKHAERSLSRLYKEEKVLLEEISALRNNLRIVDNNKVRNGMRVLVIDGQIGRDESTARRRVRPNSDSEGAPTNSRPRFHLSSVTGPKIEEWRQSLETKEAQYKELRARIEDTKNIIREPDNYVSVPNNYGRLKPEKVREQERQELLRDREAMEWRRLIAEGRETPSWMTDEW